MKKNKIVAVPYREILVLAIQQIQAQIDEWSAKQNKAPKDSPQYAMVSEFIGQLAAKKEILEHMYGLETGTMY